MSKAKTHKYSVIFMRIQMEFPNMNNERHACYDQRSFQSVQLRIGQKIKHDFKCKYILFVHCVHALDFITL